MPVPGAPTLGDPHRYELFRGIDALDGISLGAVHLRLLPRRSLPGASRLGTTKLGRQFSGPMARYKRACAGGVNAVHTAADQPLLATGCGTTLNPVTRTGRVTA